MSTTLTDARLERELAYRARDGHFPVPLAELKARLATLGYKLDRRNDCASLNRYMTGERAGESYPAVNLYIVESDTGLSFANIHVRRDANFRALQELRRSEALFSVVRGRIFEI